MRKLPAWFWKSILYDFWKRGFVDLQLPDERGLSLLSAWRPSAADALPVETLQALSVRLVFR
jgi:hypothetical protein